MHISLPSETIFHSIETVIKTYRKFAQQNIHAQIDNITIDQGIALIYLDKFPHLHQNKLAELLFKDNASFTRMINIMVKNGFVKRSIHEEDRRRYKLEVSPQGKDVIKKLTPIIAHNRKTSLVGISPQELNQLEHILHKIKANCT